MTDRIQRWVTKDDVDPEVWDQMMKSLVRSLDPEDSYSLKDHNALMTSIIDQQIIEELIATHLAMKSDKEVLYDADPNCDHEIVVLESGIKCKKCKGWFCY